MAVNRKRVKLKQECFSSRERAVRANTATVTKRHQCCLGWIATSPAESKGESRNRKLRQKLHVRQTRLRYRISVSSLVERAQWRSRLRDHIGNDNTPLSEGGCETKRLLLRSFPNWRWKIGLATTRPSYFSLRKGAFRQFAGCLERQPLLNQHFYEPLDCLLTFTRLSGGQAAQDPL